MTRAGFAAKGLFVMDGSRRSAHAQRLFHRLRRGASRVVFYDTLLPRLVPGEVEAVLAHELGHFKLGHVVQRIGAMLAVSLLVLRAARLARRAAWFYTGLGVAPSLAAPNNALALILFMFVAPVFGLFLRRCSPACRVATSSRPTPAPARHADGRALASALLKLHEDNASTLTPDPVYARFYYSHPPAAERLAALAPATP